MNLEKLKCCKEDYEELYGNKFINLEEMDKFLERHKLSKLTQEEILNQNTSKEYSKKKIKKIIQFITASDRINSSE